MILGALYLVIIFIVLTVTMTSAIINELFTRSSHRQVRAGKRKKEEKNFDSYNNITLHQLNINKNIHSKYLTMD